MKDLDFYKSHEETYRTFLYDERYLVLRLDGKAFHSYTRGLQRPYDTLLMLAMDETAKILCQEIDGAVMAYAQSDEISIVIDNRRTERTMPWLGGAIQKLVSISASMCSVNFNRIRMEQGFTKIAYFDARVMTFESLNDVQGYFNWRRDDAIKNSISMAAESFYSPKELMGKTLSKESSYFAQSISHGKKWWRDFVMEGLLRQQCRRALLAIHIQKRRSNMK